MLISVYVYVVGVVILAVGVPEIVAFPPAIAIGFIPTGI